MTPLGALRQEVGQESADQGRSIQLQRQVHAERESQGRHSEHFHDDSDHRSGSEEHVGDGLAAHEALDQRFHDRGLR